MDEAVVKMEEVVAEVRTDEVEVNEVKAAPWSEMYSRGGIQGVLLKFCCLPLW
jgi:hypothetical protein